MCVTFTGCELLCSETLNPQQSSHATLKPKLQVQIKMMVMKDKNAKAFWGFVWIKPMNDWDRPWGRLVVPRGVRRATKDLCRGSWRGDPGLPTPSTPPPLTLLCLGGEEVGASSRWIWKPGFWVATPRAISQEGFFPREGERWVPCSPLSLTETKTRLNISAKRIYKKSFEMDF